MNLDELTHKYNAVEDQCPLCGGLRLKLRLKQGRYRGYKWSYCTSCWAVTDISSITMPRISNPGYHMQLHLRLKSYYEAYPVSTIFIADHGLPTDMRHVFWKTAERVVVNGPPRVLRFIWNRRRVLSRCPIPFTEKNQGRGGQYLSFLAERIPGVPVQYVPTMSYYSDKYTVWLRFTGLKKPVLHARTIAESVAMLDDPEANVIFTLEKLTPDQMRCRRGLRVRDISLPCTTETTPRS